MLNLWCELAQRDAEKPYRRILWQNVKVRLSRGGRYHCACPSELEVCEPSEIAALCTHESESYYAPSVFPLLLNDGAIVSGCTGFDK